MSDNVINFPGLEAFVHESWRFLIDDPDGSRIRPQTYSDDPRVVVVTAESGDDNRCFVAEIRRAECDRWWWEVESRTGEIESGDVNTLAAAVVAAEASAIRRFLESENYSSAA